MHADLWSIFTVLSVLPSSIAMAMVVFFALES
jgi:hypothetical protein